MLSAVVLSVLVSAATQAGPQATATELEQERFKTLVLTGEQYFGAADFGAAVWAFRQADAIRVTPEVAYNLAKTHEKLGDLATASYYYRLYLRRAPEAQDAFDVAEILGEYLSKAEADGRGLVEIDAPSQGRAALDGKTWVELPVVTFLPPGDYALSVRFESGETVERTVSVLTGRTTTLRLEPFPPPLLNADGSPAAVSMMDDDGGDGSGVRKVLHYSSMAVVGLSLVALAAGTTYGAMSSAEASSLGTQRSSLTVTEAQTLARSAGSKGATANALFAVGGAGLVAGGALFVFTLPEPGGAK